MSDTSCHSGDNEIVQKLVQKFITSNIIDLTLSLYLSLILIYLFSNPSASH